jgi:hypothetical protein
MLSGFSLTILTKVAVSMLPSSAPVLILVAAILADPVSPAP